MTFFKKKPVAWLVLIVCVVLALFIGIRKGSVDVPAPGPGADSSGYLDGYVVDDANLLSSSTEQEVAKHNYVWDVAYGAHVAVVTTPSNTVDLEGLAYDAAEYMGLSGMDTVLVLATNGDWHVVMGQDVEYYLNDSHYEDIWDAVQSNPNNNDAVEDFLEEVDEFFRAKLPETGYGAVPAAPSNDNGFLVKLVVLVLILFVIWVIIDGIRYRRYRRRVARPIVGVPTPRYYPVFWGRRTMMPPRAPRRRSPPPPRSSRPSGSFGGSRSSRPSGSFGGSRTTRSSRPSSSFGSSRSSSSRSSFGGSRSSSSRSSSRSSFGGSRGGGGRSFGGSRGGRR